MRGVILSADATPRLILGDDGVRYTFNLREWQSEETPPRAGMQVDFDVRGSDAEDIYPVTPDSAVPLLGEASPQAVTPPASAVGIQCVILSVGDAQGIIVGDDGVRYTFTPGDWQSGEIAPQAGMRVDCLVWESNAVDIYPMPDTVPQPTVPTPPAAPTSPAATPPPTDAAQPTADTIQGVIQDEGDNQRFIFGDDGLRYAFTLEEWQNKQVAPQIGMRVDFEVRGSTAADIFPIFERSSHATRHVTVSRHFPASPGSNVDPGDTPCDPAHRHCLHEPIGHEHMVRGVGGE